MKQRNYSMQGKASIYFVILILILPLCFNTEGAVANEKDKSKISVVVIDPGHGGKDSGAKIGKAQEKDIVLNIALKLGTIIKQNYSDVKVVYTRKSDVFIPLHQRADIANKSEADLFISIHVNAVDAKSVQGTETFVLGLHRNAENLEVAKKENSVIQLEDDYISTYEDFDPTSDVSYIMFANMQEEFQKQSVMLASNIQDEFRMHAKRADRSVKMAGFLVLRRTTMPSVLIETGFLSHSKERTYLLSQAGQNALASSIYRAFNSYKKEVEANSEFHLVTEDVAPKPIIKATVQEKESTKQVTKKMTTLNQKHKPEPTIKQVVTPNTELYFTVQIMALKRKLDTTPENFKGEKNIFRVGATNINRYFSGKFESYAQANAEMNRIIRNYENAFVVAFRNNELISVKKALEKE